MGSFSEGKIWGHQPPGKRLIFGSPRRLQLPHIPEILEIDRASFPRPWQAADYAYFLSHPASLSFGLFGDALGNENLRLGAYLIGLLVHQDLDIISLATHPFCRRVGLAESLLRFVVEHPDVRRVFLDVNAKNAGGIRLYEKNGFRRIGIRKRYYEGRDDALQMAWASDGPSGHATFARWALKNEAPR